MDMSFVFLFLLGLALTQASPVKPHDDGKYRPEHHNERDGVWQVGAVKGVRGVDYPDYKTIPVTNFKCSDHSYSGLYADVEAQCQVYHSCHDGRKNSFMCVAGTVFNQQTSTCDYWYSVECDQSANYYYLNGFIGISDHTKGGYAQRPGLAVGSPVSVPGGPTPGRVPIGPPIPGRVPTATLVPPFPGRVPPVPPFPGRVPPVTLFPEKIPVSSKKPPPVPQTHDRPILVPPPVEQSKVKFPETNVYVPTVQPVKPIVQQRQPLPPVHVQKPFPVPPTQSIPKPIHHVDRPFVNKKPIVIEQKPETDVIEEYDYPEQRPEEPQVIVGNRPYPGPDQDEILVNEPGPIIHEIPQRPAVFHQTTHIKKPTPTRPFVDTQRPIKDYDSKKPKPFVPSAVTQRPPYDNPPPIRFPFVPKTPSPQYVPEVVHPSFVPKFPKPEAVPEVIEQKPIDVYPPKTVQPHGIIEEIQRPEPLPDFPHGPGHIPGPVRVEQIHQTPEYDKDDKTIFQQKEIGQDGGFVHVGFVQKGGNAGKTSGSGFIKDGQNFDRGQGGGFVHVGHVQEGSNKGKTSGSGFTKGGQEGGFVHVGFVHENKDQASGFTKGGYIQESDNRGKTSGSGFVKGGQAGFAHGGFVHEGGKASATEFNKEGQGYQSGQGSKGFVHASGKTSGSSFNKEGQGFQSGQGSGGFVQEDGNRGKTSGSSFNKGGHHFNKEAFGNQGTGLAQGGGCDFGKTGFGCDKSTLNVGYVKSTVQPQVIVQEVQSHANIPFEQNKDTGFVQTTGVYKKDFVEGVKTIDGITHSGGVHKTSKPEDNVEQRKVVLGVFTDAPRRVVVDSFITDHHTEEPFHENTFTNVPKEIHDFVTDFLQTEGPKVSDFGHETPHVSIQDLHTESPKQIVGEPDAGRPKTVITQVKTTIYGPRPGEQVIGVQRPSFVVESTPDDGKVQTDGGVAITQEKVSFQGKGGQPQITFENIAPGSQDGYVRSILKQSFQGNQQQQQQQQFTSFKIQRPQSDCNLCNQKKKDSVFKQNFPIFTQQQQQSFGEFPQFNREQFPSFPQQEGHYTFRSQQQQQQQQSSHFRQFQFQGPMSENAWLVSNEPNNNNNNGNPVMAMMGGAGD